MDEQYVAKLESAVNDMIKYYGCHPDFALENCGDKENGCPFVSFCIYAKNPQKTVKEVKKND